MLQIQNGDHQFPVDWVPSPYWPGFAPGRFGPMNAMLPRYNGWVLVRLLAARSKPLLLWVHGLDDVVISDKSVSDAGNQGKLDLRPGWPGIEELPSQPYLTQVTFTLDEIERAGGHVRRLILLNVGHTPYLESPVEVQTALMGHL
jgi:pimeloyl-ACP methyl ester carboxylesterase